MAKNNPQNDQKRKRKTHPRGKRGKISITDRNGRLRISVPAQHSPTGKQWHCALGLESTPEGWAKAQEIVKRINARILYGDYDCQKIKEYIFGTITPLGADIAISSSQSKVKPDLDVLWNEFSAEKFQLKIIKETTYVCTYKGISRRIQKLPTRSLSDAKVIVSTIQNKYCAITAYNTLKRILECCNWAVNEGKININPFKQLLKGLRAPKFNFEPDPFDEEEVQHIVAAFETHPEHRRYVPYIEFKFETGCRIEEVCGLRWRHVDLKKGEITFCEVISYVSGKYTAQEGTKTQPSRTFPISPYLNKLLKSIRPTQASPDDFVFPEPSGVHFDSCKFYKVWGRGKSARNGIVSQLAQIPIEIGGISHYRPPYNTRHTYISETAAEIARNSKDGTDIPSKINQLAKSLGTSPKVIYDHYLGRSKERENLHSPLGKKKMASISTSEPQNVPPGSEESEQQLIAPSVASTEEIQQQLQALLDQNQALHRHNQLLQQKLNQLCSLQTASQATVLVGEQTAIPETELAELASIVTVIDEMC